MSKFFKIFQKKELANDGFHEITQSDLYNNSKDYDPYTRKFGKSKIESTQGDEDEGKKKTPMSEYVKLSKDIQLQKERIQGLERKIRENENDPVFLSELVEELKDKNRTLRDTIERQEELSKNLGKEDKRSFSEMDVYALNKKIVALENEKIEIEKKLNITKSQMVALTAILGKKVILDDFLGNAFNIVGGEVKITFKVLQDIIGKVQIPFDELYNKIQQKKTLNYRFNLDKFIVSLVENFHANKDLVSEKGDKYKKLVDLIENNKGNLHSLVIYPTDHAKLTVQLRDVENKISDVKRLISTKSMKGGRTKRKHNKSRNKTNKSKN